MKPLLKPDPATVETLPFRLTRGRVEYGVHVVKNMPGGSAALFDRHAGVITVRAGKSAADLVESLKGAAPLMETWDSAEQQHEEFNALLGQVEELGRLVEAALPASHVVARRFWSALDALTENSEPSEALLSDALEEFDALPIEERRRIMNGWTPAERPTYAEVASHSGDVSINRVMEITTGGRRSEATCSYVLDDAAGVHPVRVLLTQGVTKRQVLDGLREAIELVANAWDELVGTTVQDGHPIPAAAEWFNGPANEKGEASPMPNVPALAGNRNEEGAEAKPASSKNSR